MCSHKSRDVCRLQIALQKLSSISAKATWYHPLELPRMLGGQLKQRLCKVGLCVAETIPITTPLKMKLWKPKQSSRRPLRKSSWNFLVTFCITIELVGLLPSKTCGTWASIGGGRDFVKSIWVCVCMCVWGGFGSSHMESLGTRLISTTRSMNLTSLKSDVSSSSSLNHLH